ncbi:MAG: fibrobacter succinogenes major paralogous domain-containing protein [Bacteroidia bacterium]|nr:fibrobacter succinogenes major paralogous domain-containing protein [Bacteroidia bacterium]
MKKSFLPLIFFFLLFTFPFFFDSNAQIPQGINYQAVGHTSTGAPIANTTIQVKAAILSDTITPVIVWEELHSTVKTNASGIFGLVIGTGTRQSGSASAFGDIDWGKTALYLKIQLYYQNAWKNMGISRLWSVPYAMVADDLSGSVKKLAVTGETSDMEEALFEVKNKEGQTVFAVYNEGVRIYVDDGAKGAKGGFAVGGFGTSKTPSQNLLYVSADSIRAYIETDPAKGAKGGFAVGGFGTSKGLSQDLFIVSADSIRAYIDAGTGKGVKGGFAVGGFGTSKSSPEEYLRVTRDSTRVYLVDPGVKGNKGGFAIGGYGSNKAEADNFFFINPDSSRFYVRKLSPTSSSTFDIIGFNQSLSRKSLLSANADTVDIQGVLTLQNDLIVEGNINLGGNVKPIAKAAVDGDGNTYPTVILGNQVWMAENLRTTRYSNGNLIGTTTLPGDTIYFLTEPKYQWPYSGIEGYAAAYGRLYTWYAATDTRNICPTGYHLPNNAEWDELLLYLEDNGYGYGGSGTEIAKSMASRIGWNPDLTAASNVGNTPTANNSSGFSGMPGGFRDSYGLIFTDIGNSVYWWSSTLSEGSYAYSLNYANSYVTLSSYEQSNGYSIRCVQDNK